MKMKMEQTMDRVPFQRLASPCEVLHIAPPLVARPGKPPQQRLTAGETALSPIDQAQRWLPVVRSGIRRVDSAGLPFCDE